MVEVVNHKILPKLFYVNPKSVCLLSARVFVILSLHILFGWIWLGLFAVRCGVLAASKFVPGLGRPWTFKDVLFLEDYNQRHRESLVELVTLQGDISCAKIRQLFTQNVLKAKINNPSSSHLLKFPELTQMRRAFLGFLFWADEQQQPCFKIENHIKEVFYGDPSTTPKCFNSFETMMEEFTQRPYLRDTSPWEIWVVRDFPGGGSSTNNNGTLLLWRSHHSLADGYSTANILVTLVGLSKEGGAVVTKKAKLSKSPPTTSSSSSLNIIFSFLVGLMVGFCRLQSNLVHNKILRQRMHAERRRRMNGRVVVVDDVDEDKVHFKLSPQLPLSQVKALAASLGVRVPVLLTTLVAQSFGKAFDSDFDIDSGLYSPFVLPLANHPDTLANHMSLGILHLPISKSLSFESRLKSTNDSFLGLSSDPVNPAIAYLERILGNCPGWMVGWLKTHWSSFAYYPISISTVVLDSQIFQSGDVQAESVIAGMAPIRNAADSAIVIQGFGESVRVSFAVSDSLLGEEDVERMASGIGEDFDKLFQKKFPKC